MEEERTRISEHIYSPKVDVIIPTCKPGKKFSRPLKMLEFQTYPVRGIIVMNTEKAYWNDKKYQGISNMEVYHLSKIESDHGAIRNRGIRYSGVDIIVFVTDDAVPVDEHLIEHLADAFKQRGSQGESVIMAYARQLLDKDCPMVEHYARFFSYSKESCIKTKEDPERMGIETFFASNACCAYDREKFWFQGGFIIKIIFNEGMIFADRAVFQDDYAIAYVAEVRMIHSHNYGRVAQFRRNFDLAVFQTDHPEVFAGIRSESEGTRFMKQTAGYLVKIRRSWLIPGMTVKSRLEHMGYRVGRYYRMLSKSLAVKCSMNKEYWK